jgi:hypothetical protein
MLFSQALAQYESVLSPYGDNERGAERESGGEGRFKHEPSVLPFRKSLHLNFLALVKFS